MALYNTLLYFLASRILVQDTGRFDAYAVRLGGAECITVPGAAFGNEADHGWNMVQLDGRWYCVNGTWNANAREQVGLGRQEGWDYFNVTSNYTADIDHQWDYANTPETMAGDCGRD